MAREHRYLKDGNLTVIPFTSEEEVIADQQDTDRLAADIFFNSPVERIKRVTEGNDINIVMFKLFFKSHNRTLMLENKPIIRVSEFLTSLESELT